MVRLEDLSDAQIILLAVDLCAAGHLDSLHTLAAHTRDVLADDLLLRILLTFLPGSTEPERYLPLLHSIATGSFEVIDDAQVDTSSVEKLEDEEAYDRVGNLSLVALDAHSSFDADSLDTLSTFLLARAYQVDQETRDLPSILRLAEPFIDHSNSLRQWLVSILLPILRSEYEYYPEHPMQTPLHTFEGLDDRAAITSLLQRQEGFSPKVGRDLRCLVGPWMYGDRPTKRRKLSQQVRRASTTLLDDQPATGSNRWDTVNDWILTKSQEDLHLASQAFIEWEGPSDVDLGGYAEQNDPNTATSPSTQLDYIRVGLAIVYAAEDTSQNTLDRLRHVLQRARQLRGIESSSDPYSTKSIPHLPASFPVIANMSRAALFHNTMLQDSNDLTSPNAESFDFCEGILNSVQLLRTLGMPMSSRQATELCLFASEDIQRQELHRLLQGMAKASKQNWNWSEVQDQISWLRSWGNDDERLGHESRALFWRVDSTFLQMEFLDALLTSSEYGLAVDIFFHNHHASSLTTAQAEEVLETVILRNYDNASNGNRTRGGMKRASDMLRAFRQNISPSSRIHKIESLLAATHSLSFYHLTLQHGVPFQPVSIRIHPDPIALIGKVLEQNPKAYTQLDDLISIGQNFVRAGLPISDEPDAESTSQDKALLEAERRITYMAMESALSSADFDTAYSYILTRLTPQTSNHQQTSSSDDYSWRAAYLAGQKRGKPSAAPLPLSQQIASLSKRMELLSLALTLVPTTDQLPSILGQWRRCEEELNTLRSAEAEEEAAWDARGDNAVPGGFGPEGREDDIEETRRERARRLADRNTTRSYEEEAPMGLFDVARGAARAIGKSAFPLRASDAGGSATAAKGHVRVGSNLSQGDGAERNSSDMERSFMSTGSGEGQRVRKRDMVSSMVTGGLVSGMSWVLGAQPAQRPSDEDD